MRKLANIFISALFIIAAAMIMALVAVPAQKTAALGVTFADFHAANFGLDPKQVFVAILDDLKVRRVRLSAYWDKIEPQEGVYDFEWLDWQVREAAMRNTRIILAVGRKLPRWPECFIPAWAQVLSQKQEHDKLLLYIEAVVRRYRDEPSITMWQVENEPFLPFGKCPSYTDKARALESEVATVHHLDSRPVLVTDSGELSMWVPAARQGDIFGTTMYRTVWNKYLGYFTYPIPPAFFRLKRAVTELFVGRKPMIVVELQGEPWYPGFLPDAPLQEQYRSMNVEKFKETMRYAKNSGFDTFYLWGVEWWYWLKERHNDGRIWEYMKSEIQRVQAPL